jgi:UDPglucose 6-dehydrogenase|tara:strand:+ start:4542 stop:5342 length:801 start_codon:yes stop_codon:yes gene_type:complete
MSILKLGIIGKGFVGSAVSNGFDVNVDQFIVDPNYNDNTIEELVAYDVPLCFVCVPTPQQDTHLDVDISIVREVLVGLTKSNYKGIVVIKSTITPQHLTKMKKDFILKLVYNPEFLTEANSLQDFLDPDMQILGGKWKDCEAVEKAYIRHSSVRTVPTFKTDLSTASLIKYTINSWLATKVTFFNELKVLFEASSSHSSWDQFTDILTRDPRIGNTHLKVPGPDGLPGFGGHCFPKDTNALLYYAKLKGVDLSVLKQAIKKNNSLR